MGHAGRRLDVLHAGRAADVHPLVVSGPALDVPCRFADAIRISFWGFLFNLAPLGIVGGDVVKAVMLDHEHRGHRAKAVASVLVDRVIGLYVLFLVASAAILLTGFWRMDVPESSDLHGNLCLDCGRHRGPGRRAGARGYGPQCDPHGRPHSPRRPAAGKRHRGRADVQTPAAAC